MSDDLILIVDESDKPVGSATRQEAWAKGLRHRIVFIVIEDEAGRILLQKRTMSMKLYPGRWTVAASGHVDAGEDYDVAAKRELAEELGLTGVPLEVLETFSSEDRFGEKKLRRFDRVYKAVVPAGTKLNLQADELAGAQWFKIAEIRKLIANPDNVSPILAYVINKYYS